MSRAPEEVTCHDCNRPYGDEYGFPDLVLPNATWAAISPTGDEGGMLCPSCICKRLADRGLEDVPAVFRSGPCCALRTDAPEGPWEAVDGDPFWRVQEFDEDGRWVQGCLTFVEAIAVRNALNGEAKEGAK